VSSSESLKLSSGLFLQGGRYKLIRQLAQGGQAAVWQAEQSVVGHLLQDAQSSTRYVALKVLGFSSDEEDAKLQVLREAQTIATLKHPYLVDIYEAFEDTVEDEFGRPQSVLCLAMEFIEGYDLGRLLEMYNLLLERYQLKPKGEQRGLPWQLVLSLMIPAFVALEMIHHAKDKQGRPLGLIHRDLKPNNLMLEKHGMIRLIDFGIARSALNTLKTRHGAIKGTMGYLSPDQMQFPESLDYRSDLFSIGIVFYELLAGSNPFFTRNPLEAATKLLMVKPPAPISPSMGIAEETAKQINDLVMGLLEKDRDKRIQDASLAKKRLKSILGREQAELDLSELAAWLNELTNGRIPPLPEREQHTLDPTQHALLQTETFGSPDATTTVEAAELLAGFTPSPSSQAARHTFSSSAPSTEQTPISRAHFSSPAAPLSPASESLSLPARPAQAASPALPTGQMVGFDDPQALAEALEEENRRMPTQAQGVPARSPSPKNPAISAQAHPANPAALSSSTPLSSPSHPSSSRLFLLAGGFGLLVAAMGIALFLFVLRPQERSGQAQEQGAADAAVFAQKEPLRVREPERKAPPLQKSEIPLLRVQPQERTSTNPPEKRIDEQIPRRVRRVRPRQTVRKSTVLPPLTRPIPEERPPALVANAPPVRRYDPSRPLPVSLHIQPPCELFLGARSFGMGADFSFQIIPKVHAFRCQNEDMLFLRDFRLLIQPEEENRFRKVFRKGTLVIHSTPWADVMLSPFGKIGRTPFSKELYEGNYKVILHPEGKVEKKKNLSIKVKPNEKNILRVTEWN
jgi:serine/threonine protein kinase